MFLLWAGGQNSYHRRFVLQTGADFHCWFVIRTNAENIGQYKTWDPLEILTPKLPLSQSCCPIHSPHDAPTPSPVPPLLFVSSTPPPVHSQCLTPASAGSASGALPRALSIFLLLHLTLSHFVAHLLLAAKDGAVAPPLLVAMGPWPSKLGPWTRNTGSGDAS